MLGQIALQEGQTDGRTATELARPETRLVHLASCGDTFHHFWNICMPHSGRVSHHMSIFSWLLCEAASAHIVFTFCTQNERYTLFICLFNGIVCSLDCTASNDSMICEL